MRPLGIMMGASLLFGALVLIPARYLLGEANALQGLVALALCLVPSVMTLAWAVWSGSAAPEQNLLVFLGGSGLRMGAALGGGLVLTQNFPDIFPRAFWLWVLFFYTFTLSVEIVLLVGRHGPQAGMEAPAKPGPSEKIPPGGLENQAS